RNSGNTEKVKSILLSEAALYEIIRKENLPIDQLLKEEAKTEDVFFRVTEVRTQNQKEGILKIAGGSQDGIFEKSSGTILSSYSVHNLSGKRLGTAEVQQLGINQTILTFHAEQDQIEIKTDDLVKLVVLAPKRE